MTTFKLKLATGISVVAILLPMLSWALWIYCFNSYDNQAERVKIYKSLFPEFLQGRYSISLISLLLCFLAIILASIYWNKRTPVLKTISNLVFIFAGLMVLLALFSLM